MQGVERTILYRVGSECVRATSIVLYETFSKFSGRTNTGGEEFYVLEGVFSDEHQSYKKGSYVRNPIGTSHTPKIGKEGATIFVKLQQFNEADTQQKVIDTTSQPWQQGLLDGLTVMPVQELSVIHIRRCRRAPLCRPRCCSYH